jgi:hypothetical protein
MRTTVMAAALLALQGSMGRASHLTTISDQSADEYEQQLIRCAEAMWLLWTTTCAPRVMVRAN